jgi:hypothetical protein
MPTTTMTETEQRMAEDFAWALQAPEVQQNPEHFGKLVVVHEKRVLAVGRERQALLAQAAKNANISPEQLVVVLVPRPGLWETPR